MNAADQPSSLIGSAAMDIHAHFPEQSSSLLMWRERARARERRAEYLSRAAMCHDMAARAHNAQDQQFLRAMTMVWRILTDRHAGVRNAAPGASP